MSGAGLSALGRMTRRLWVKENGSDAILTFYIPTHRDEAAMNGAPVLLWLVEGEQATARQKQILRFAPG